jgi:hypothetical protein
MPGYFWVADRWIGLKTTGPSLGAFQQCGLSENCLMCDASEMFKHNQRYKSK